MKSSGTKHSRASRLTSAKPTVHQKRYARDPELYKAKNARWRVKTSYEWSRLYPDRRRKSDRLRYKLNPDKFREKNRKFHNSRPEIRYLLNAKRRARKYAAKGSHTINDLKILFNKQKAKCCCGATLSKGYTVDHKNPLSRGGSNWPRNLQLLCRSCNSSKGNKTMREWVYRR